MGGGSKGQNDPISIEVSVVYIFSIEFLREILVLRVPTDLLLLLPFPQHKETKRNNRPNFFILI